jgi:GntR family transcriptional regulator / MocR family aminotransferase
VSVQRSSHGLELLLEVSRERGRLHRQIEDGVREGVRSGRLVAGTPLPSSRSLAAELGVARSVVVEAYDQLAAEGFIEVRPRALPRVAAAAAPPPAAPAKPPAAEPEPRYDLRPGAPDLALFPRADWLRSVRAALLEIPDAELDYGPPEGALQLRATLAEYLGRVRGVRCAPGALVVCHGVAQAMLVAARAVAGRRARVAVEDPGHADVRASLEPHDVDLVPVPVDDDGLQVDAIPPGVDAVLVTPAHQYPMGAVLTAERRAALVERSREEDFWILEDDYDAEHRYDRAPIGAMQGLAPDRVVSMGSVSKTLAPALRLGWMAVPDELLDAALAERASFDRGLPTLDQLALAEFIARGALDRHVRRSRRHYRRRRDALVAALPAGRTGGVAAGLHMTLALPAGADERAAQAAIRARGVAVDVLGRHRIASTGPPALLLGYGRISEAAIPPAVRALAGALED